MNDFEELENNIKQDFPDVPHHVDKELAFYNHFIPLIYTGEKTCTIRFRPGKIRIPSSDVLPCYATSPTDPSYKQSLGFIDLEGLVIATVDDFPLSLAKQDGFSSKEEMIEGIGDIYNYKLQPTDIISLYFLGKIK